MHNIVVQLLGLIAFALFLISYQVKSNKLLFFLQAVGNGCFAVHFVLLGTTAGGISALITVFRNAMLVKYEEWKWVRWKGWVVIISALSIGFTILTWSSIFSLFAAIAAVSSTIAYWTNNARTLRVVNLFCSSPAWLVHNLGTGSIGGAASDIFTMGSVLISIYRFGWKALAENDFDQKKEGRKKV